MVDIKILKIIYNIKMEFFNHAVEAELIFN